MKKFEIIMIAIDGGSVKDSNHETIEAANEAINDMGSKWFFYPFASIVRGQTVKQLYGALYNRATGENILNKLLSGKRLKTVKKLFMDTALIGDDPMDVEEKLIDKLTR